MTKKCIENRFFGNYCRALKKNPSSSINKTAIKEGEHG